MYGEQTEQASIHNVNRRGPNSQHALSSVEHKDATFMNAQPGRTVGRGRKKEEWVCSYRPLMCKDANYVDVEETSLASSHGFSGRSWGDEGEGIDAIVSLYMDK